MSRPVSLSEAKPSCMKSGKFPNIPRIDNALSYYGNVSRNADKNKQKEKCNISGFSFTLNEPDQTRESIYCNKSRELRDGSFYVEGAMMISSGGHDFFLLGFSGGGGGGAIKISS